jgi:hypothetical protein
MGSPSRAIRSISSTVGTIIGSNQVSRRSAPQSLLALFFLCDLSFQFLVGFFLRTTIGDIGHRDIFLSLTGGLSEADHVGDRIIGNDPGTALQSEHIRIEPFPHHGIFYAPGFVEEPEDFPFVGADEINARQQRLDDLHDFFGRFLQ